MIVSRPLALSYLAALSLSLFLCSLCCRFVLCSCVPLPTHAQNANNFRRSCVRLRLMLNLSWRSGSVLTMLTTPRREVPKTTATTTATRRTTIWCSCLPVAHLASCSFGFGFRALLRFLLVNSLQSWSPAAAWSAISGI